MTRYHSRQQTKRRFKPSVPDPKAGSDNHALGMHFSYILPPGSRHQVLLIYLLIFAHFTMGQLKPGPTLCLSSPHFSGTPGPWLSGEKESLHKILAQPSALCPQPGKGGPLTFAELGTDSEAGGLLIGSKLCWMGPTMSQAQTWHLACHLVPALCSDGGTTIRVRKASLSSLQPDSSFVLVAFIQTL